MTKKVNYLNNRELLKEIHKSKISFSFIEDEKFFHFDGIVDSLTDLDDIVSPEDNTTMIHSPSIVDAKQKRANRIATQRFEVAMAEWTADENAKARDKPRPVDFKFSGELIPVSDLVIRVMSFDHVPVEHGRKKTLKSVADRHAKCNFPPFKHVTLSDGAVWREVVRSHWKGDLVTGKFSTNHGRITERLGGMMITLSKRYSMKANWRGYTYVDEMRSQALVQLSQIGLQFNEAKGDNPFAYYTATMSNSFTRVFNMEKRNQGIRDDLLQETGQMPSFTRQVEHDMANHFARESHDSNNTPD